MPGYDLATFADLAGLSIAAYTRGAALKTEVASLGWSFLDEAFSLPGTFVGLTPINARVIAAERVVAGRREIAIVFEGTAGVADLLTDITPWGFSYYYRAVRSAVQTWLEVAIADKENVDAIYISGHSLGGAAAQIAMLDILSPEGVSIWTPIDPTVSTVGPLGADDRLTVSDRAWLRDVVRGATIGAPSISIDSYSLIPGVEVFHLNPGLGDLSEYKTRLFQFEHKTAGLVDPVAALGSINTDRGDELGQLVAIGLAGPVALKYFNQSPAAGFTGAFLHASNGYRESLLRALTDSVLIDPVDQAGYPGLQPTLPYGDGSNLNEIVRGNGNLSGFGGNDILVPGLFSFATLDGGPGRDTYVINSYDIYVRLVGAPGDTGDRLLFNLPGILSAQVVPGTDDLLITLREAGTENAARVTVDGWYSAVDSYKVTDIQKAFPWNYTYWSVQSFTTRALQIPEAGRGTGLSDWILGSVSGSDTIAGLNGNDTIEGRGGDDTLYGDALSTDSQGADDGIDGLSGGDGNDTLYGGGNSDSLNGDAGTDWLYGGIGDDVLDGGPEAGQYDALYGQGGNDRLNTSGGNDHLEGGQGNDLYVVSSFDGSTPFVNDAGSGTDTLRTLNPGALFAETRFIVGGGNLTIEVRGEGGVLLRQVHVQDMASAAGRIEVLEIDLGSGENNALGRFDLNLAWAAAVAGDPKGGNTFQGVFGGGSYPGQGDDIVLGTPGPDTLDGLQGDDTVYGFAGDDRLFGSAGNDNLNAGTGNDQVSGGAGNDVIHIVADGVDVVAAGAGYDTLYIDASTYDGGGWGSFSWGGFNASGVAIADVGVGSSLSAIETYLTDTQTKVLKGTGIIYGFGGSFYEGITSTLSFTGVERIAEIKTSTVVAGSDLILASDPGNFEAGLGDDMLYADLSAASTAIVFDAASDQTYAYEGYTFKDFEAFAIRTGSGDDRIDTSGWNISDTLILGEGNNQALVGGGNNTVTTGAGNDLVVSGSGVDIIDVGNGTNTVIAGAGNDRVTAGSGNDTIDAGRGADTVDAGGGNDVISLFIDGVDSVSGGAGNDRLSINGGTFAGSGVAFMQWASNDSQGNTLSEIGAGSSYAQVTNFLNPVSTYLLKVYVLFYNGYGVGASVTFSGIEALDVSAGTGIGPDIMFALGSGSYDGGTGTDTFYADWSALTQNITWINNPGQVQSVADSTVSGFERLLISTGAGNDTIDNTLTDANDEFRTGAGNDLIAGGRGNDYIDGGDGIDTADYRVATGGVVVDLAAGTSSGADGQDSLVNIENVRGSEGFGDTLTGDANANVLEGLGGNDTLVGAAGDDTLYGGTGDDVLQGGIGNDQLYGEAGVDQLFGGDGDDLLDGGSGNDTLEGGAGNDLYVVSSSGDVIVEALDAGTDSVNANITYTLPANVENLTLVGTAAIRGTGNASNNFIVGNALRNTLTGLGGNDVLDGKTGADTLIGGTGDDTYYVDNVGDVVTELAGEGTDLVFAAIDHTLAANVENLVLSGTAARTGTGNELNNRITGNAIANTLNGGGGNDTLFGLGGNDVLDGGSGDDRLSGGNGRDTLTGGAGADRFAFDTAPSATNADTIADFDVAFDSIRLSSTVFTGIGAVGQTLAAEYFAAGAGLTAAPNATVRFVLDPSSGRLFFDADGVGGAAAVLMATFQGSAAAALTASSIWIEDGAAALVSGDWSDADASASIGSVPDFTGADDLYARASILSVPDGPALLSDEWALHALLEASALLGQTGPSSAALHYVAADEAPVESGGALRAMASKLSDEGLLTSI